jgi:hypothetical protein
VAQVLGGRASHWKSDAELVCLAVAQVLLRFDDERHWLRAAPKQHSLTAYDHS